MLILNPTVSPQAFGGQWRVKDGICIVLKNHKSSMLSNSMFFLESGAETFGVGVHGRNSDERIRRRMYAMTLCAANTPMTIKFWIKLYHTSASFGGLF
jgi:hypothetical protein